MNSKPSGAIKCESKGFGGRRAEASMSCVTHFQDDMKLHLGCNARRSIATHGLTTGMLARQSIFCRVVRWSEMTVVSQQQFLCILQQMTLLREAIR